MASTVNAPRPEDFEILDQRPREIHDQHPRGKVIDWTAYKSAVITYHLGRVDDIETKILPVSVRVLPARLGWGKFSKRKAYSGFYEYVLEIKIDGKRVGDAVDNGDGGGIHFHADSAEARASVEEIQNEYDALRLKGYGLTNPAELGFSSEETLWNHIIAEVETAKTFARIVKANKKTIVLPSNQNGLPLLADDKFGLKCWEDIAYATINAPLDVVLKEAVKVKDQAKVSHVWNGIGWVAL